MTVQQCTSFRLISETAIQSSSGHVGLLRVGENHLSRHGSERRSLVSDSAAVPGCAYACNLESSCFFAAGPQPARELRSAKPHAACRESVAPASFRPTLRPRGPRILRLTRRRNMPSEPSLGSLGRFSLTHPTNEHNSSGPFLRDSCMRPVAGLPSDLCAARCPAARRDLNAPGPAPRGGVMPLSRRAAPPAGARWCCQRCPLSGGVRRGPTAGFMPQTRSVLHRVIALSAIDGARAPTRDTSPSYSRQLDRKRRRAPLSSAPNTHS